MHTPSGKMFHQWNQFSEGPVQLLSSWHSRTQLSILRLDLVQSWGSGNKYYKLKYALQMALANGVQTIVSKGGMFSNHLAALAEACQAFGIQLVSVIRSYAPDENNPTVRRLRGNGSDVLYVIPEIYKAFDSEEAERLFPGAMFIPEGGLSDQGIRGTAEIMAGRNDVDATHIIVPGGSMGTAAGIISSAPAGVRVIIVPAWKGCTESYFFEILQKYKITPDCSWELWPGYHFGGFGRFDQRLIDFMSAFSTATGIPLDPVYTGKMMYAIDDKWRAGYFDKSDKVVAIHTGGLQGLEGYSYRYPADWESYAGRFKAD